MKLTAPDELPASDLTVVDQAGVVVPIELVYVERDTCPLPALVTVDAEGNPIAVAPGQIYTCPHYTWTVVWVQIRGGMAQPSWIIRPPVEESAPSPAPAPGL